MSWRGQEEHTERCIDLFVEEHGREPTDAEWPEVWENYLNSFE